MEAAGQDQVIVVSLEEKGNVTPGRKKNPCSPTTPLSTPPWRWCRRAAPSPNTACKGSGLPSGCSEHADPRDGVPWFPPEEDKNPPEPCSVRWQHGLGVPIPLGSRCPSPAARWCPRCGRRWTQARCPGWSEPSGSCPGSQTSPPGTRWTSWLSPALGGHSLRPGAPSPGPWPGHPARLSLQTGRGGTVTKGQGALVTRC